jgi:hypothetical protein
MNVENESAQAIIEKSVGRTIARVSLKKAPSTRSDLHQGEVLSLRFTDDSALILHIGSTLPAVLGDDTDVRPSDVQLSFVAVFTADGILAAPSESEIARLVDAFKPPEDSV